MSSLNANRHYSLSKRLTIFIAYKPEATVSTAQLCVH